MLLKWIFTSVRFIVYNFKDDLLNRLCVQFNLKDLKSESPWKICVC